MTPTAIDRVGFVVHAGRAQAGRAAADLLGWLRERGVRTRSLPGEGVAADDVAPEDRFAEGLGLVVSVGGDGTLLRAASLASAADVPVLGVNVGRLGFLTEVVPDQAPALLNEILDGRLSTEERMAIEAVPLEAPWSTPQWALNEIIVEKVARHRLIRLGSFVGGEYVTAFAADGVIVATPTGSTAYSFSARGPIVSPRVACLMLVPVSPHMLFDRSLVLAPEEGVTLEVQGDQPGVLSADGRPGLPMPVGSRVRIERSLHPARLVRRPGSPDFLALLREKFSLPGEAPHGDPTWEATDDGEETRHLAHDGRSERPRPGADPRA
jgi:NAD+ kinase